MIQATSLPSKFSNHFQTSSSSSNYTPSEIEKIQRQLEISDDTALRIAAQPKKLEKKGYAHSNRRDLHGAHLMYSEMQLADAPTTAFSEPSTIVS